MADHRAEDIVTTIITQLTGLATTGANVFRDRAYEMSEDELPALLVYMVADNTRQPSTMAAPGLIDSDLRLIVEAVVKDSAAQVDTTLNQIRYEVGQALHEDVTQGLAYVMHTTEGSALPELQSELDQMVGRLRLDWSVLYRRVRGQAPVPPVLAGYPLDDDGTLAAYFGAGHLPTVASEYNRAQYVLTSTEQTLVALPAEIDAPPGLVTLQDGVPLVCGFKINAVPEVGIIRSLLFQVYNAGGAGSVLVNADIAKDADATTGTIDGAAGSFPGSLSPFGSTYSGELVGARVAMQATLSSGNLSVKLFVNGTLIGTTTPIATDGGIIAVMQLEDGEGAGGTVDIECIPTVNRGLDATFGIFDSGAVDMTNVAL